MTNAIWKQSFSSLLDDSLMSLRRNSSAALRLCTPVLSIPSVLFMNCMASGFINPSRPLTFRWPQGIPKTLCTSSAQNFRIFISDIMIARRLTLTLLIVHALNLRFSLWMTGSWSIPPNPISVTNHLLNSSNDWITSTALLTVIQDVGAGGACPALPPETCSDPLGRACSAVASPSQLPSADMITPWKTIWLELK